MSELFFEEMKRYVRFGPSDEAALRMMLPYAASEFENIADKFYRRIEGHVEAHRVFSGPEQVRRLKGTLCEWLHQLLSGPWDQSYFELRSRIGWMHVKSGLPQRYMFGAMNLIRESLGEVVERAFAHDAVRRQEGLRAISKLLDLELAIMLETYREAFVEQCQELERHEKATLEQRLAVSEARYQEIVEKSQALVNTMDVEGRILLFNRRCEELTGLSRIEAAGRPWLELFAASEDREMLRTSLSQVQQGGFVPQYEGAVQLTSGDPRRVRWHFTTLPGGHQPVLCAIGIDVTEEHLLAVRTRHAERLATLGAMAAGLAHEIRNPLNAAHLQLTLTQRRLTRPGGADINGAIEAAGLVSRELQRLARIVEEFLDFARPQPLRLVRGDLRETAHSAVSLMIPEAASAGVDLELSPGLPVTVDIDDERLKQAILNLVRNGIEAAGRGGRVEVRVDTRGQEAFLEVLDNGPGLPTGEMRLFEPFWTTKPGGTGLGLSIVHRIVGDHGGKVSVRSRAGETIFTVQLPLTAP